MSDAPSRQWEGDKYARESGHHRAMDRWFLDRHPPRPADRVVDAGCGSGEFTLLVAELVPEGHVIGVEPDPSMLEAARRHRRPNVEFRQGRMQALDEVCEPESADLVLSRAVFHWIPLRQYVDCYRAIRKVLVPGGWLHAESGGAGNVSRIVSFMDDVSRHHGIEPGAPTFPDPGTVLELLEEAGLEVPEGGARSVAQRRRFDRDQLLGFLETQAATAYVSRQGPEVRRAFLDEVRERVDELRHHDGSHDQVFVRLDVLARRPEDAPLPRH